MLVAIYAVFLSSFPFLCASCYCGFFFPNQKNFFLLFQYPLNYILPWSFSLFPVDHFVVPVDLAS